MVVRGIVDTVGYVWACCSVGVWCVGAD